MGSVTSIASSSSATGQPPASVSQVDRLPGTRSSSGAPIRQTGAVTEPIDLPAALARFDEPWSPRTVAVLNDYDIRVVKTKGEFTRHRHLETDEGSSSYSAAR